jgi:DNA-binding CsgD family transcriptional regulator
MAPVRPAKAFAGLRRLRAVRIDWGAARSVLLYGGGLAVGAFALQWLEYRLLAQTHALEIYVALVAAAFLALGVWVGSRLFRPVPSAGEAPETGNPKAKVSLGISDREMEVLQQIAAGLSNKEIALRLHVSPNTVKTHVARVYEKLGAKRRTDAVLRARELGLLP